VQLTEEENALVKKNNLAGELLVYYDKDADKASITAAMKESGGWAAAMVHKMRDTALTVAKLVEGTEIVCDNVGKLVGVESEAKEAVVMLKCYLDVSATFGSEEVLDIDRILAETDAKP